MPRDKTGHFYFAWYPTIYEQDTGHLSLAEDGAYRRLIDQYMTTRSPLTKSDKALARIVGIGVIEWGEMKENIIPFFKDTGTHYAHTFCDSVLSGDTARILRAQENGKKGGRPSHYNQTEITQSVSEPNPVGTPNHTNQNKTTKTDHIGLGGQGGYLHANGSGVGFVPTLETADRLMQVAPGWDQNLLIGKYNDWQRTQDRPRNPQAAFIGWAKNFTKGKQPC